MAQRPAELTPLASPQHFFGAELRSWRRRRSLSLAQLGRMVYVSADLIGKVEKAQRWPSEALVDECEAVLDSGGALPRLYTLAVGERPASSTRADASVIVAPSTAIVVVVAVYGIIESSEEPGESSTRRPPPTVIHARQTDSTAGVVGPRRRDHDGPRRRRFAELPTRRVTSEGRYGV